MATSHLREQIASRAVAPRYNAFFGVGLALAVAGLILFAMSLTGENADRAWHLFHVNWVVFTGLTAGSFAFVAVQKITNAKWSGFIIRFAEAVPFFFFPVSLIGFLIIFTVGYHHIFPEFHGLGHGKEIWLSHGFMFGRLAVGLSLLFYLGFRLVRADLIPDMFETAGLVSGGRQKLFQSWSRDFDPSPAGRAKHDATIRTLAPMYAITYAIVMTLIAFDCMMALQPHWFSNLFGGWYFMGSFLGAHTLLALLMIYGRHEVKIEEYVSPKQRHDLGKLIFGFSVFWTYLMWAQFLVIWYGNMPEETGFVFARLWGPWRPIGSAVFLGMFVIPFIGLLGVAPKKNTLTLGLFSLISLCSLWLERYLMVLPSVTKLEGPTFGLPELGPTALFLGLFLFLYAMFARTFPMVSPRLAEITHEKEHGGH
ncbi:MAG: hypothetical protein U0133_16370 [Gemmatimonadales bacterium]